MNPKMFALLALVVLLLPAVRSDPFYSEQLIYEDVTFEGAEGAELVGRVFIPYEQNGKGIVLYHGFSGSCEGFYSDKLPIAQSLADMGYTVLTYDHRAHDQSTGTFDFEYLVDDAISAITVLQSYGVDRIGVMGHSMGGMIAVLVSAYDPRVECTVAWAAPKSINSAIAWILGSVLRAEPTEEDFLMAINKAYGTDLAMERLSVPVNFGNLHTTINDLLHFFAQSQLPEYKPIAQAEKTDCIRFVHGTADDTVNPQDSVDMYNLAQNPKDMFFIEGASHGADGHEAEFLEAIVSWFALQF
ncbi:MAG: alpha/beta fold hydrolase [Candidatus Thermoplasmatota archaeon]|nr:alpha/beta fold hydrolase [Candidatus Thermoplasmatota archaeon]